MTPDADDPVARTRQWMERAVIGLNLCPFAKAVAVRGQVRFVLSDAATPGDLLEDLARELAHLRDVDPRQTDTTLLIHPQVLGDFLDYNDFLGVADALVEAYPDPDVIVERNLRTLRALGHEGWSRLFQDRDTNT